MTRRRCWSPARAARADTGLSRPDSRDKPGQKSRADGPASSSAVDAGSARTMRGAVTVLMCSPLSRVLAIVPAALTLATAFGTICWGAGKDLITPLSADSVGGAAAGSGLVRDLGRGQRVAGLRVV